MLGHDVSRGGRRERERERERRGESGNIPCGLLRRSASLSCCTCSLADSECERERERESDVQVKPLSAHNVYILYTYLAHVPCKKT